MFLKQFRKLFNSHLYPCFHMPDDIALTFQVVKIIRQAIHGKTSRSRSKSLFKGCIYLVMMRVEGNMESQKLLCHSGKGSQKFPDFSRVFRSNLSNADISPVTGLSYTPLPVTLLSMPRSGRLLLTFIAFSGMVFAVPQGISAAPITHTLTIPLTTTNWTKSIDVPKFDGSLGMLSEVRFSVQSTMSGTLKVESLDSAPVSVQSTLSSLIRIRRPDQSVLMTHTPSVSNDDSFGAYDNVTDYSGNSGKTYSISKTSNESLSLGSLSASDSALFMGNGVVTLPVTAVASSGFAGGGNLHSISTVAASATITVTYVYTEPDMAITKSRTGSAYIGGTVLFTLGVRNVGNGATTGEIVVTDTMPGGLWIYSSSADGWDCSVNERALRCTRPGPVAAGAALPNINITAMVTAAAYPSVINTAYVQTDGDRNGFGGQNSATLSLAVEPAPVSPLPKPVMSSASSTTSATSTTSSSSSKPKLTEEFIGEDVVDAKGCPVDPAFLTPFTTADVDMCFTFDPLRPVTLTDIANDPQSRFIETLKKTKIAKTGDYILGGNGNNSTGNEGSFPFEPLRTPNRFEMAKLALVSNCIGVEALPPQTETTFTDVPRDSSDELKSFMARVMYTAAKHGIIKGYKDGNAYPEKAATNAEVLAVLLRAANAMPRGFVFPASKNWYDPYVTFAKKNLLVPGDFSPEGTMTRSQMSALLVKIMALNPDPKINAYAAQINTHVQAFQSRELLYLPLPSPGVLTPDPEKSCAEKSPLVNFCLGYDPARPIQFSDLPVSPAIAAPIELLKNTMIVPEGDYVFSGVGNHSTGKQQDKYKEGSFPFGPGSPTTRLEVVKTALVSNCLPILDEIPDTDITFTDIPKNRSDDDVQDFTARVFYSAALYGVIGGFKDGSARPQDHATKLETIAILLRAGKSVPEEYKASMPKLDDLPAGGWYEKDVSFAMRNNITPTPADKLFHPHSTIIRSDFASLLAEAMRYSGDLRVRSYRTSVDPLLR